MIHPPYTVALFGPLGRLGKAIASALLKDERFDLTSPVTSPSSQALGKPLSDFFPEAKKTSLLIGGIEKLSSPPDLFIDCALAEATLAIAQKAAKWRKPLLIASTGHTPEQKKELENLAKQIPILVAPNLSPGIALLLSLLEPLLSARTPSRMSLEETHRAGKKDKPSGTALSIEQELRKKSDVLSPIISHRIDGKPVEHRLLFSFPGEELEISHRALDRNVYAIGAIEALLFLIGKEPGLYSMKEVFSS